MKPLRVLSKKFWRVFSKKRISLTAIFRNLGEEQTELAIKIIQMGDYGAGPGNSGGGKKLDSGYKP